MSRLNNRITYDFRAAAASAGTATSYRAVNQAFYFTDFSWFYESTEANADNTLDFVIDYTEDGTNYTALYTNGNAMGLGDTGAALNLNENIADAASGGATGVSVTPTVVRVPKGAVLRCRLTTAGTGTVPAIQFDVIGQQV